MENIINKPSSPPVVAVASATKNAATATTTTATSSNGSTYSSNIFFRHVCPTDLPKIYNLERSSYPKDEAASKSQIQYRQHHAAPFFRCAVHIPNEEKGVLETTTAAATTAAVTATTTKVGQVSEKESGGTRGISKNERILQEFENQPSISNNNNNNNILTTTSMTTDLTKARNSLNEIGTVIGFITATRCTDFTEESMKTHNPNGNLLAIHSVVIEEQYRNKGIGKSMIGNYIKVVEEMMQVKINQYRRNGGMNGGMSRSGSHGNMTRLKTSSSTTSTSSQNSMISQSQQQQQQQQPSSSSTSSSSSTTNKTYLPQKKNYNLITKIVLMSKMKNIPFYIQSGFQVLGPSPIVHGQDTWYDCVKSLDNVQEFLDEQDRVYQETVEKYQRHEIRKEVEKKFTLLGGGMDSAWNKSSGIPCWTVDSFAVPTSTNTSSPTTSASGYIQGSGNPAGVVMIPPSKTFHPESKETMEWMQIVAKEFNLSETAFIWKISNKDQSTMNAADADGRNKEDYLLEYHIRFYTCNGTEVDLCGHATLAASSVIFQQLKLNQQTKSSSHHHQQQEQQDSQIIFHAKHNVILKARVKPQVLSEKDGPSKKYDNTTTSTSKSTSIIMKFPAKKVIPYPKQSESYTNAINMMKQSFFHNNEKNESEKDPKMKFHECINDDVLCIGIDDTNDDLFIHVSPEMFDAIPTNTNEIHFKPMMDDTLVKYNRGVIISCQLPPPPPPATTTAGGHENRADNVVNPRVDFQSRFFGPKVGIEEDPVTGSAHCVLGPYYSKILDRMDVKGYQMSQRGGLVECRLLCNENVVVGKEEEEDEGGESTSIEIIGTAVIAMSGSLYMM